MNYLPYAGYWFYGATSDSERASYFCSYGLLATAPVPTAMFGYDIPTIATIATIPSMWRQLVASIIGLLQINWGDLIHA